MCEQIQACIILKAAGIRFLTIVTRDTLERPRASMIGHSVFLKPEAYRAWLDAGKRGVYGLAETLQVSVFWSKTMTAGSRHAVDSAPA